MLCTIFFKTQSPPRVAFADDIVRNCKPGPDSSVFLEFLACLWLAYKDCNPPSCHPCPSPSQSVAIGMQATTHRRQASALRWYAPLACSHKSISDQSSTHHHRGHSSSLLQDPKARVMLSCTPLIQVIFLAFYSPLISSEYESCFHLIIKELTGTSP